MQFRQYPRAQLRALANRLRHGTTRRFIDEAVGEERPTLRALPAYPYTTVLRLERRLSRDGTVNVEGNEYSVPDRTRRRTVEVHRLAEALHIYDACPHV